MGIQTEVLRFEGHGGDALAAELLVPEVAQAVVPGVLLVRDGAGADARPEGVSRRLAEEGLAVLEPDLRSRGDAAGELDDRRAMADLDAAARALGDRERVDARSLAVLGYGAGGTLALLLGCTSTRVAAVVSFSGAPLHAELSRARPTQPLELILNLDRPLLAFFGERDAEIPREDVELLRAKLEQSGKAFDLVTYPEAAHRFFDDRHPDHHAESARDAWSRTLGFLRETL